MKYLIALLMLVIPMTAYAGHSYDEVLFTSVTGTESTPYNTKEVLCFDGASVLVVMGNFTGTVAIQASVDDGTTYQTYTTVSTGGGTIIYSYPETLVPTHLKVVPTDTFVGDPTRGGVSAHISIRECY